MKKQIKLLIILFYFNSLSAQEKVYKAEEYTNSNSSGTEQRIMGFKSENQFGRVRTIYGNINPQSAFFLVYTTKNIDDKFKSILDSLVKYKIEYDSNRQIDFESMKKFFLDIQKNLKQSIDSIPQIVTTTDVAKLLKAQIIQDLKGTEISNLNNEISELKASIDLLKLEIDELKKKKVN